jgi:subtilisin
MRALYVKPTSDYWEYFVLRPALNENGVTVVQLKPLTSTFPNFPQQGLVGWGQKLMGLDAIAPTLTGRGVKIAIIDSGCDNTHPQLTHVQNGMDFTENGTDTSWTTDTVSHGTHCAGIITGSSRTVQGIRGFAPEAEVHSFKVFPGGRFSSLIDALDQCIAREIDVVNMSLGSDQVSELVTRKIQEALDRGVALIVAAGNSGGPVQFPGNLTNVMTVAAVGQLNQYPEDTNHAQNVLPGGIGSIFPAKFSCYGSQIDICGPGVAIASSVPGGGYAAWDGTSMATPHVTGLAALILAHHPAFQGQPKQRNALRVAQLYQLLTLNSAPVVTDPQRGGAGLPSAAALFGTASQAAAQPVAAVAGTPATAPGTPPVAAVPPSGGISLPPAQAAGSYGQPGYPAALGAGYPYGIYGGGRAGWSLDPALIQMIQMAQMAQMRAAGLL